MFVNKSSIIPSPPLWKDPLLPQLKAKCCLQSSLPRCPLSVTPGPELSLSILLHCPEPLMMKRGFFPGPVLMEELQGAVCFWCHGKLVGKKSRVQVTGRLGMAPVLQVLLLPGHLLPREVHQLYIGG